MKLLSFSGMLIMVLVMSTRSCDDPIFDGNSCSSGCYIVAGKIIDSASKSGIPNLDLTFYANPGGYSFFGRRVLVKTRTNQMGEYRIAFDATNYKDGNGYFSIAAENSPYFIKTWGDTAEITSIEPRDMNLDEPFIGNYSMFWPGYIKLRVKAGKATAVKNLSFLTAYSPISWRYSIPVRPGLDTLITVKTASGIQTRINWFYAQALLSQKRDSLTVPRGGTVDYNIEL